MSVIDLIFPISCLECRIAGKYICDKCLAKVSFSKTICPVCLRFSFYGKTHDQCLHKDSLSGLAPLWNYEGVIRKSLIKLKYKFAYNVAHELAKRSVIEIKKFHLPKGSTLVPIPLHIKRENWRGFNQANVLGEIIAKEMDWKFIPDLLIRTRNTPPQVHLHKRDRIENVKDKFKINKKIKNISDNIILFDDVWTTGSTLKEGAATLKKAGVKNVWGLTIARAT